MSDTNTPSIAPIPKAKVGLKTKELQKRPIRRNSQEHHLSPEVPMGGNFVLEDAGNKTVKSQSSLYSQSRLEIRALLPPAGTEGRSFHYKYLAVPFGLITQLVLQGESPICPGSP